MMRTVVFGPVMLAGSNAVVFSAACSFAFSMRSSFLTVVTCTTTWAVAVFPFALIGNVMTPSFTLKPIDWNTLSLASAIQQPRLSQTSTTAPSMSTFFPLNLAGAARISETVVFVVRVTGLRYFFGAPAEATCTESAARSRREQRRVPMAVSFQRMYGIRAVIPAQAKGRSTNSD